MTERGYQYEFSKDNAAMHESEGRSRKAATMLAVLEDAIGRVALGKAAVLNVGCSTGIIDAVLAERVATVVGIDIDETAIELARRRCAMPNLEFRVGDAMALDFPNASIDVIICSQVYEHVPNPRRMMDEIRRVLAPGGVCYFAATNRFCIMEQHYHLPMLSVIPLPLAHMYLRIAGRGNYYHERHESVWGLRNLVQEFEIDDYTIRMLGNPDAYAVRYMFGYGIRLHVAKTLARVAYWAFPGYVWLLKTPRGT